MTAPTPGPLTLDLAHVPFTRAGSFFAISRLRDHAEVSDGLYLRTVHGDARNQALLRLELVHGETAVEFTDHATPSALVLRAGDLGEVEICVSGSTVVASGDGVALRMWPLLASPYDVLLQVAPGRWQYTSFGSNVNLMFMASAGALEADSGWNGLRSLDASLTAHPTSGSGHRPFAGSGFVLTIEEFQSSFDATPSPLEPRATRSAARSDFEQWPQLATSVPARYSAARDLAAYVNWSSSVGPWRNLKRPTMYMSKNWMTKTWSWDHCFNAMALTQQPHLAMDQFLTMFDHQDAHGALPDCVDDAGASFNFAKPPIHGWTWRYMTRRMEVDLEQSAQVYDKLSRLTHWWLSERVTGSGLPHYRHGNDSGWDNGTSFARVVPVESPDLCAFLVIQMDVLAEIAGGLKMRDQQQEWTARADHMLSRLIDSLWCDGRFVARGVIDREPVESQSLLMYVPIVLGSRLPTALFSALAEGLSAEGFLTPHGLATESVRSPRYEPDGYWRGPVWAPSTFIIHEGLLGGGERDLAQTVARRFCDTVLEGGMAENFDALTGEGLRDRAYTWTSSVFLLLAESLAEHDGVS